MKRRSIESEDFEIGDQAQPITAGAASARDEIFFVEI